MQLCVVTILAGRRKALDELENVFPSVKSMDTLVLKLIVQLTRCEDSVGGTGLSPRSLLSSRFASPAQVTVRLYTIRAFGLTAKDRNNTSDPFITATIDGKSGRWPHGAMLEAKHVGGKEVACKPQPNTLNPYFGCVYEWKGVSVPGPAAVTIRVVDHDGLLDGGIDDEIGSTVIDIEDRYFSADWHRLWSASEDGVVRKPLEHRDLLGESGVTQGVVEMWLEVFPASDCRLYPYVNIQAPKKQLFELRVVVWDASRMKAMDSIGSMNDLYVSGTLSYRNAQNQLLQQIHSTDVHWRAKKGTGHFNYRLIWTDLELPMDIHGAGEAEFPRFTFKAWDQDVIGGNDLIGSADVPEVWGLFRRGWARLAEQSGRDEQLSKMSIGELVSAVNYPLATHNSVPISPQSDWSGYHVLAHRGARHAGKTAVQG
jgi:hypothetical protein